MIAGFGCGTAGLRQILCIVLDVFSLITGKDILTVIIRHKLTVIIRFKLRILIALDPAAL